MLDLIHYTCSSSCISVLAVRVEEIWASINTWYIIEKHGYIIEGYSRWKTEPPSLLKSNGINWCWKRLSHAMSLLIFTKSPLDVFCLWIFHHFVRLFSNSFLPQLSSFGMPPVLMRERERERERERARGGGKKIKKKEKDVQYGIQQNLPWQNETL